MEISDEFVIQSLSSLLDNGHGEMELMPIFNRFHTRLDTDVEDFLKDHAIDYEKSGAGRTWLVLSKNVQNMIVGYFTIGLNTLHFAEGLDDVEDAYPGIQLYNDNYLPVYALFLIGKDDKAPETLKMGALFIKYGLQWIRECKTKIGGSLLYLDCVKELVDYYSKLGFQKYDNHRTTDKTGKTITLYTMIMAV